MAASEAAPGWRGLAEDPLHDHTYVVEHNPNCPSPYLVRLNGGWYGVGSIDKLYPPDSMDAIGYGQTFGEAARAALADQAIRRQRLSQLGRSKTP